MRLVMTEYHSKKRISILEDEIAVIKHGEYCTNRNFVSKDVDEEYEDVLVILLKSFPNWLPSIRIVKEDWVLEHFVI